MVIPIKSVIAIAKHLMPFGAGSVLPVAPRLPDFPAALFEAGSIRFDDDQKRETETPTPAVPPAAPPFPELRERRADREERAAERRPASTERPQPSGAARGDEAESESGVRQALQALDDLKQRGALPAAAPEAEAADEPPVEEGTLPPAFPLPEGAPPELEAAPAGPGLPPPAAVGKYASAATLTAPDAVESTAKSDPLTQGVAASRGSGDGLPGSARTSAPATRPAEIVDRIVKAARLTQSRGLSRIKIVLNPPHLGELKIDLSVRQHVLQGRMQAQTAAAQEMILAQLDHLRESLENQGIHVGGFQVTVDQSFQQSSDSAGSRPPPGAAEGDAAKGPEARSAAERGLRSARVQVLDVVA